MPPYRILKMISFIIKLLIVRVNSVLMTLSSVFRNNIAPEYRTVPFVSIQVCDRLLMSGPERVRHHRGPQVRVRGRECPVLPRDRRRGLVQHRVLLQVIYWQKGNVINCVKIVLIREDYFWCF